MFATHTYLSIPLGIIAGLFASFVQSLGLTIQRKSHVLNQTLPEHRRRVEHRRPLWLIGFAIFISSNILGSLVQIASLPVVILAPLGAVSLLWNAFFARFILGDVFSPWMIIGTILIAGGAILIAFFGIVPEPTRSLEDLLLLFRRPTFIVYFSLLGFIVIVCLAVTHIAEISLYRRMPSDPSSSPSSTIHPSDTIPVISDTIDDSLATERTPLLDRKLGRSSPSSEPVDPTLRSINRTRLVLAILFASFSGIISGMCLLFAKSGVELLLLTLTGNNQFWRWEAWVLVLGLIVFALLQLLYLHKALIFADPTLVCPSAFCFYNLSSIVNGLVYFDQFSLIPPVHLGLVVLGIFVLLGGVWVVSIHSGGGGVDVGTWNESNDFSCQERSFPDSEGLGGDSREATAMSMATQPITNHAPIPNMGSEVDDTVQDSSVSPAEICRPQVPQLSRPQIPLQRSLAHSAARLAHQSSASMHSGMSRTGPQPHCQNTALGPVSALGPGFQIGLSPLSPGFAIVPLDRRRRMGGRPSLADVATDLVNGVREAERRAVSDGVLARGVQDVSRDNGAVRENHDGRSDVSGIDERRGQLEARRRWHWIRTVFTGKD